MKYLGKEEIAAFADELTEFRDKQGLRDLFLSKIDHIAVKMRDAVEYEQYKKDTLPNCIVMTEASLNGRRISTAWLEDGIEVVSSKGEKLGVTNYVEIMEPRPHKVGKDLVGIDHCEIDIESFIDTRKLINEKNIAANQGEGENEYKHTVVIRLNSRGQEVKFSDESLSEIIPRELSEGVSKKLK